MIEKLNAIYNQAVERTKEKIIEDIERFMEWHEQKPSLTEYLQKRNQFIQHIWNNIWSNKAQSAFSVKERKKYLIEKGIAFDETNKKLVKKLFINTIIEHHPFPVMEWIKQNITEELWNQLFEETKQKRMEIEKQRLFEQTRQTVEAEIHKLIRKRIDEFFHQFYTYVRYRAAVQLKKDMNGTIRYKLVGRNWENERLVKNGYIQPEVYKQVNQFFEEFTGGYVEGYDFGKLYWDFETYGDRYFHYITDYTYDIFTDEFAANFSHVYTIYERETGKSLKQKRFIKIISDQVEKLADEFYKLIAYEYVSDLLETAEIPYDVLPHLQLLSEHQKRQEERRIQEEIERKRKQEKERRMMADVFGQATRPKGDKSVHYILHIGETNTGKTFRALESLKQASSGCYLAPLRLLALEVYEKLNADGIPCNLKTGEEEKETDGAKHVASTVEMFYEKDDFDCIVIDEAQMIADQERGFAWYRAITSANANEVHIIGSKNSKEMLLQLLEGSDITLYEYEREIPLRVEHKNFSIDHTKKGDALICFSRKRVLETASLLQRRRKKVSMIYGSMPPETRKKQIERFIKGETHVVVSTDAIGMGLNLPIKRIVFLENEKFDGIRKRRLTSQEVKQIAGRAGRKGIYNVGKVAFVHDYKKMEELLFKEDVPLKTFTIAPTNAMLERFQKYSHHLGDFFELWKKFKNPKGTVKAPLTQEQELYELIKDTEIEARFSIVDLYGFLHLPFSSGEKALTELWLETMQAIVNNDELPEPPVKRGNLEQIELTYKAIGLHLLFLYKLGKKTEASYWERLRQEISDEANDFLKKALDTHKKQCKRCGKKLSFDHPYAICDRCYNRRFYHEKNHK